MKSRIFGAVLAATMAISAVPALANQGNPCDTMSPNEHVYYGYDDNGDYHLYWKGKSLGNVGFNRHGGNMSDNDCIIDPEDLGFEVGTGGVDGIDGIDGVDGKSAFEIAKDNGFTGTEQEWLDSLKGDKGDKGDTGAAGVDGKDGVDGVDGVDGKDGVDGAKGDKGDKGDTGATGAKGDKGDKGDTGAAGVDGKTIVDEETKEQVADNVTNIKNNTTNISKLYGWTDKKFTYYSDRMDRMDSRIDQNAHDIGVLRGGVAGASALAMLQQNPNGKVGEAQFSFGVGHFDGATASALMLGGNVREDLYFNVGGFMSDRGKPGFGASLTWTFETR